MKENKILKLHLLYERLLQFSVLYADGQFFPIYDMRITAK